jgi:hypothetical protein
VTLGPIGTVAHPLNMATPNKIIKPHFQFILPYLLSWLGRRYIWYYLHPSARTTFDVRVVALWILAVIPIARLLLLRFTIDRRLMNNHRRGYIIGIRIEIWKPHDRASPIEAGSPPTWMP